MGVAEKENLRDSLRAYYIARNMIADDLLLDSNLMDRFEVILKESTVDSQNPCEQLLKRIEKNNTAVDNRNFDCVLKDYRRFGGSLLGLHNDDSRILVLNLIRKVHTTKYSNLLFTILKKFNYDMRHEIRDAIQDLCLFSKPDEKFGTMAKYIYSPVIQGISFNGKDRYTIYSEQYGKFEVEIASEYFKRTTKVEDYLQTEVLERRCHFHTYFLSKLFPEMYAITSLCQSYFGRKFFHSYTYDSKEDIVIDFTSNAIMSRDDYYSLYLPKEVSVIKNSDVRREVNITQLKTAQCLRRHALLKVALYKLYLQEISYNGSLEEAPILR